MSALIHPHPGALLRSAARPNYFSTLLSAVVSHVRRSGALASLAPTFLLTGLVTGVLVAVLQLTWYGPIAGFDALWLKNWLIAWPIAFPFAYIIGPALVMFARYLASSAETSNEPVNALVFGDIAAASARATERHGFTVLRNLKVREDFQRA